MLMIGAELTEFRKSLGMRQAEFGRWLADKLGQENPYPNTRISAWERGHEPISWAAQAAVYKHLWEASG